MADETSGSGYHHVGSQGQSLFLLLETDSVVASVDGHARYGHEIGESFHLLVNLHGQLAGGGHDDAVDGIFRITSFAELVQHGQQVGGRLAGTGLCHSDQVVSFQNDRDGLLLHGGAFLEVHGIECVQYTVF